MLQNDNGIGATMLVSPTNAPAYPYPVYGGMGGGNNNGFGGDWAWIILLLLLAGNGGWGGGFGGFGGNAQLGMDFPWLMNGQQGINNNVSDGFRDAQLHDSITSVRDGISNLSTQLCGCCGDMQMALANGFSGVEQGANARQIANMQTAFGQQMATAQGFSNLASQLAECCCENRLGIANLNSTIISENCADRQTINEGVRDIIANQTAGTQRILDQLCADKIDAKNEKIADLERQLTMANLQASQTAQTARIERGQIDTMNSLVNELRSCPIPSQPVAGNTPLFSCNPSFNGNNGCGCGCGGNF